MKRVVWKNKSNDQLCVTIPKNSEMQEGDYVEIKKSGIKRISYVGVVGDLFHYGHLQSIQFAKSVSDYNIIGVFTDEAVEEYRVKPISNLKERKAVIENLKVVDRVLVQYHRDPTDNLQKIHEEYPDAEIILIHGDNWGDIPGAEYIKSIGGKLLQHPYYSRLSNFKIINYLLENKDKFKDIKHFASVIKENKEDNETKENFAKEWKNKNIISTKADTLKTLQPILTKSKVEKLFSFTINDWKNDKKQILEKIKEEFPEKIVVRSSVIDEQTERTLSGCFKSLLDVEPKDNLQVEEAINETIASYKNKAPESSFHQVLVQNQTNNIKLVGSALIKNNPNKYIINYSYTSLSKNDETIAEESKGTINVSNLEEVKLKGEFQLFPEAEQIFFAVKEIEELIPRVELKIEFVIDNNNEIIIFQVKPLFTSLYHGWGGTTSLQSLECHTLRYIMFPEQIGNSIIGKIFTEVRDKHHTVYFDQEDIKRWNYEGFKLINKSEQEKVVEENKKQIAKFFSFYEKNKNINYILKTNKELFPIYNQLINLVMENGSFFPYSREEPTKAVKDRILSLIIADNKEELLQLLTTPTKEDLFLKEKKDKLKLIREINVGPKAIKEYALKYSWRFINTYSWEIINQFLENEISETNAQELENEINKTINESKILKQKQEECLARQSSNKLKELCLYLQEIALIRLENKNIWAGYELLFLGLFKEIAKRLELNIEDFLFSYRIKDVKDFLEENKKLTPEEVKKRLQYFNIEISPESTEYSFIPKYSKEVNTIPENLKGLSGDVGNLGRVKGRALVVTDDSIKSLMKTKKEMTSDDIYITTMTHPAMVSILHKTKGIITDEGGITSHAAIISRELNIPCLVGTRISTRFFKTGDFIEVDTYNKFVRKLTKRETEEFKAKNIQGIDLKKTEDKKEPLITIKKSLFLRSIPYTSSLNEINEEEYSLVGGKGKNLAKCSMRYNVPKAFSVTRRAYDQIINSFLNDKEDYIIDFNYPEQSQEKLKALRKFVNDYQFSDEFKNEVLGQFKQLNTKAVAVRSSASSEDSSKASFAGQFKTLLGIEEKSLFSAIKECIASAFKENVLLYAHQSGISQEKFYISVVIQEFLQSEKAGVLFSQNPSDSLKEGIWIDANFGVGESVVSGKVKPDQYFINGSEIEANIINEEREAYSYIMDGSLEVSKKTGRVLNEDEIKELVQLGESLRQDYGKEIECEWCYYNNELHLLQVRPITTLKGNEKKEDKENETLKNKKMKVIILAAGRGSRLHKYTEILPKGLLPLAGKPLLQRQIETFQKAGLTDISIVRGFNAEKINFPGIKYYNNPDWENTNMVASLFCAEAEFDGSSDILIAYADTIHEPKVIKQIMEENFSLSKAIDVDYKDYWTARNGDWKEDSESCTLNPDGSIIEIGEENVIDEARLHGRDASLTFISKNFVPKVLEHWRKIKASHWDTPLIDGKPVRKINMTNLLQSWIDNGWTVMANKIQRGWMEFDTNEDYENALKWTENGEIKKFIDLNLLD
ncbi:NTP transferase domain-containing protein [Candidatus Woesearchaeota archaeon]|jgi:L-glutamine-phosphate cytidylyltransferase|nr:NTP transferase domain-containing protein [Candidatus Woesearchaeota archaeon]MBT5342138.1 NTP transferase domain-containing protein [Candidatus Woesearchaeota archaeon]